MTVTPPPVLRIPSHAGATTYLYPRGHDIDPEAHGLRTVHPPARCAAVLVVTSPVHRTGHCATAVRYINAHHARQLGSALLAATDYAEHEDALTDAAKETPMSDLTTSPEGNGTRTIRRTIPKLPTTPCAVIVANDGHEYITATFQGVTYHAREAVLDKNGVWRGAWRGPGRVKYNMYPSQITPDCWKVDDQ